MHLNHAGELRIGQCLAIGQECCGLIQNPPEHRQWLPGIPTDRHSLQTVRSREHKRHALLVVDLEEQAVFAQDLVDVVDVQEDHRPGLGVQGRQANGAAVGVGACVVL